MTMYSSVTGTLDVGVMSLSTVRHENTKFRIDSGYFSPQKVALDSHIRSCPSGYVELGMTASKFRKGIFDIKAETYVEEGIPFIRIGNIARGFVSDSNMVYIEDVVHEQESKSAVAAGDIVLSKTAYAAAALVHEPSNVSQDVIAYQMADEWREKLLPEFVVSFLNTPTGIALLNRQFQGNVQLHLSLADAKRFPVPLLSLGFQERIVELFRDSFELRRQAIADLAEVDSAYSAHMPGSVLSNATPNTFVTLASQVRLKSRWDSKFHSPRTRNLFDGLGAQNLTISDVVQDSVGRIDKKVDEDVDYIEIGDVSVFGDCTATTLGRDDLPTRAKWVVKSGDVITSTVRPIRRLSALVGETHDGAACSSGFAVLRPADVEPEVLLAYMRLPPVCELMDILATSSMYPSIAEGDIRSMPFLRPTPSTSKLIVGKVRESADRREESQQMREDAIQAVELAVTRGEAAGAEFLDRIQQLEDGLRPAV